MKNLKIVFLEPIIVTIFLFGAMNTLCNAAELPRLFVLSKGKHTALVLPVMRDPTVAERDPYLNKIITPLLLRATTLYDESARPDMLIGFGYSNTGTPEDQLPPQQRQRLDAKFTELAKHDGFVFPARPDRLLNDFAKMMSLLIGPLVPDPNNLRPSAILHTGSITDQLARQYPIDRASIEGMHHFYRAYFTSNSDDKAKLVDGVIDALEKPALSPVQANEWYSAVITCLIQATGCALDMPLPTDRFLRTDRNKLWLAKVNENSQMTGVPFYALAAANFLPDQHGPGFLAMLKENGYSLKLVRSLSDVPRAILNRKPIKRLSEKEQKQFLFQQFIRQ